MAAPFTILQVKDHLKIDRLFTAEDELLTGYLVAGVATFERQSKRKFPDPNAVPLVPPALPDPAIMSADESLIAGQWLRLLLGHWYENRQAVAVGINVAKVPETCDFLMMMLREPSI